MQLLVILDQPGPELLLQLLLAEHKLNITAGVVDLGLLGVDLGVELKLKCVRDLFRCGGALESELGGLQVELLVRLRYVGRNDGEEDVVLFWLGGR